MPADQPERWSDGWIDAMGKQFAYATDSCGILKYKHTDDWVRAFARAVAAEAMEEAALIACDDSHIGSEMCCDIKRQIRARAREVRGDPADRDDRLLEKSKRKLAPPPSEIAQPSEPTDEREEVVPTGVQSRVSNDLSGVRTHVRESRAATPAPAAAMTGGGGGKCQHLSIETIRVLSEDKRIFTRWECRECHAPFWPLEPK